MREILANLPGGGSAHISIDGPQIASVEMVGETKAGLQYCSAGLVDIQVNGLNGVNFSAPDLTPEKVASVLPHFWASGVTSFCPTLISNSLTQLERNFAVLEQARQNFPHFAASAPCYHLEGPYLSPGASRGAHDPRFMHAPDLREFERLQTASGGRIGILTLAPELPNALALIESASKAGIRIGLSHTDCTPDTIWAAVRAGATLSTHLGNGCPEMIHRHRTPIWAQLAADELYASIICDMFHLPGELVKVVFRMKGPDKCILVSDAIHLAGMRPGKYALLTTPVELLPDGKIIRSSGGGLAGSTLTMEKAVSNFMRLADISLEKALQAAVTNPANFLRSAQIARSLAPGNVANVILFTFDGSVHIESCLLAGEQVYP